VELYDVEEEAHARREAIYEEAGAPSVSCRRTRAALPCGPPATGRCMAAAAVPGARVAALTRQLSACRALLLPTLAS